MRSSPRRRTIAFLTLLSVCAPVCARGLALAEEGSGDNNNEASKPPPPPPPPPEVKDTASGS